MFLLCGAGLSAVAAHAQKKVIFGSKLNRASGGKFPLNFSYNLVKYFDGENDGLVSENSLDRKSTRLNSSHT